MDLVTFKQTKNNKKILPNYFKNYLKPFGAMETIIIIKITEESVYDLVKL